MAELRGGGAFGLEAGGPIVKSLGLSRPVASLVALCRDAPAEIGPAERGARSIWTSPDMCLASKDRSDIPQDVPEFGSEMYSARNGPRPVTPCVGRRLADSWCLWIKNLGPDW